MRPCKNGPGEINVPVCCGGHAVMPGYLIVADPDGVIVVPAAVCEEVLSKAEAQFETEERQFSEIEAGRLDRDWVAQLLQQKGMRTYDSARHIHTAVNPSAVEPMNILNDEYLREVLGRGQHSLRYFVLVTESWRSLQGCL